MLTTLHQWTQPSLTINLREHNQISSTEISFYKYEMYNLDCWEYIVYCQDHAIYIPHWLHQPNIKLLKLLNLWWLSLHIKPPCEAHQAKAETLRVRICIYLWRRSRYGSVSFAVAFFFHTAACLCECDRGVQWVRLFEDISRPASLVRLTERGC